MTGTIGKNGKDIRDFYSGPALATDIIIEYTDAKTSKTGIVVIRRKNFPHGLALPGGFAEYGLSFPENARKEAKEETGLDVTIFENERPVYVSSAPGRDPRGHVATVTYVGKGSGILNAGDDAKEAFVCTPTELDHLDKSEWAFTDHASTIRKYVLAVYGPYMDRM